jgi:hypothetical protein
MRLPSYQAISPDETSPLNTQVVEQGTFSPVGSNDSTPATPSSSLTPIMTKKASGVIVFLGAAWCGMLLYLGISPLSMDALKPWNYRSLAGEANTIKMCVKEMVLTTKQNSVGALVECWDKDVNEDDRMCEGTTGQNGCVVMNYKEQAWDGREADLPTFTVPSTSRVLYKVLLPIKITTIKANRQHFRPLCTETDPSITEKPMGVARKCWKAPSTI